ncbi:hypothetical protein N9L68_02250 [bacterium]|nr:hypothetical protein [bacterium]
MYIHLDGKGDGAGVGIGKRKRNDDDLTRPRCVCRAVVVDDVVVVVVVLTDDANATMSASTTHMLAMQQRTRSYPNLAGRRTPSPRITPRSSARR